MKIEMDPVTYECRPVYSLPELAARYVINGNPLKKLSRERVMILARRLHLSLCENAQTAQSRYDTIDTDLSRSRARERVLARQVGRWKRATLAVSVLSALVLTCLIVF